MTPTVSVVLNCYNHEPYVAAAIESVLAQTCRDFELILIDNGSTDGSRRVMQSFDDERIRLILHDDNIGPSVRFRILEDPKNKNVVVLKAEAPTSAKQSGYPDPTVD